MTAAAVRLESLEEKFGEDWPAIARLAPHGEQRWALIMAWIGLGSLPWQGERVAVFDSLQLRQALAEIFSSLGMAGEAMWRATAKVRVLLLQADAPDEQEFWNDGDVRWLAGVNESDGVTYVNKELFEELIDLFQLPALLEIAEQDAGVLEAVLEVEAAVEQAREAVLNAGYDLDKYLASDTWETEEEIEHAARSPEH
jgi:hypothetical protein